MALGYPNGYTKKEIPFEAQIIRVADEYDAIVSKRQYKTHVNISDTLQILIDQSKPHPNDPKVKVSGVGRVNPIVVRALLKIVKVDIEYEISCILDYVSYLKKQIKRLKTIQKWHKDMENFTKQKDKDYYMKIILQTFESDENLNNYNSVLEQYIKALKDREERIQLLFDERNKIKKMEC